MTTNRWIEGLSVQWSPDMDKKKILELGGYNFSKDSLANYGKMAQYAPDLVGIREQSKEKKKLEYQ